MVINSDGLVFAGRRIKGVEARQHEWQMPQGGIDAGEETHPAALRELLEETGISSVKMLAQSTNWLSYDFPTDMVKPWGGYIGQTQKWFAFKFIGTDDEINLNYSPHAEFSEWKWVTMQEIVNLVVPFKRTVYETVVAEFANLAGA